MKRLIPVGIDYTKKLPLFAIAVTAVSLSVLFARGHTGAHTLQPIAVASPTPPDICLSTGTTFETTINQMPIPNPTPHPIDSMCPRAGSDDGNQDHAAQNEAKNNFLALGSPLSVTFADFTSLQARTQQMIDAHQIHLNGQYPANRNELRMNVNGKNLGEGTLVTLEAYVYGAHYSNTEFNRYPHNQRGTGEANNCKCNRVGWNDIHIALAETADLNTDECKSVTAEISPHYRSLLWSRFHDGQIAEIEAMLPGLLRHRVIEHHTGTTPIARVRITGPLFYDASHRPCSFNSAGAVVDRQSPQRRSIWEIHPVYRIQAWNNNNWVDLRN